MKTLGFIAENEDARIRLTVQCYSIPINTLFSGGFCSLPTAPFILTQIHIFNLCTASKFRTKLVSQTLHNLLLISLACHIHQSSVSLQLQHVVSMVTVFLICSVKNFVLVVSIFSKFFFQFCLHR